MSNLELAKKLVQLVGGKENVLTATNCMTRLRLTVKDASIVKGEEIKGTEGVLGYVADGRSLQIVLGPGKAKKVTDICTDELGLPKVKSEKEGWEENKASVKDMQKQSPFKKAIRTIADIFIPLIPAIIAAGLFNGLTSLITTLQGQGVLAADGFWQILQLFFGLIGNGFLGYFAIYTGINSAKQFGATEALGGMIGGMSIGTNIVAISTFFGLYNEEQPLNSILTTGKGGIIGVIVGVWILAKVENSSESIFLMCWI